MSRTGKIAMGYGILGLVAVTVGAFMIHTGLGVLVIGGLAVISAHQVIQGEQMNLRAAANSVIQDELKEQMGDLGDMFKS